MPNLKTLEKKWSLGNTATKAMAEVREMLVLRREHAQKELEKARSLNGELRYQFEYWRGRFDELNEQLGEKE